jgi:hypothetical protein
VKDTHWGDGAVREPTVLTKANSNASHTPISGKQAARETEAGADVAVRRPQPHRERGVAA